MQNQRLMPPAVRAAYDALHAHLAPQVRTRCPSRDGDLFLIGLERYFADFYQPLQTLYGTRPDFFTQLAALGEAMLAAYIARPAALRLLDLERQITPDWFQHETMVGYVCYVDRFAGTLQGVRKQLAYLCELGVSYLHLMPLLQPRPGPNDGGYAVQDYRTVDQRLGSMADLAQLAADLHAAGISLCVDLVLNHTAREHQWAQRALAGDAEYMEYYYTFPDRTLPDAYERTLREVFPDFAPGNFTWEPAMAGGRWVWTTFNRFQWDLNYSNPAVFRAMAETMFYLANQGVDVLRLDAVPFMWKRLGTDCENQPEAHLLLQAFRALMRVVAPGVIFKAEAIVPPDQLIPYLGVGPATGKECEIAYNNQLMVLLWSSLATRKVTLMTHALHRLPPTPPNATWVTYVRCHDDIGWAITDENAELAGESGFWHRQFLNEFYSGAFPGSFAAGAIFQYNPLTRDARISGGTAALAGLEQALAVGDAAALDRAIRRILLHYSVIMAYGGIPLIYMGDEIGILDDTSYLADPAKADDNRWRHRPPMDWARAAERTQPNTVAGRIYAGLRALITARTATPALHGGGVSQPMWSGNEHVFALYRRHPQGRLVLLANFQEGEQHVATDLVWHGGLRGTVRDLLDPRGQLLDLTGARLRLGSYQSMWLVDG